MSQYVNADVVHPQSANSHINSSLALPHQSIDERVQSLSSGVDAFFLIFAGALVYFMQLGFAMVCAGSIHAKNVKNVKNVMLWNLLDSCGGGLSFWAVGYAFAYGGDLQGGPKTFVGNTNFFLMNDGEISYYFWFFQYAFASAALYSIVAGTIAERTQMIAYLCYYSIFLVGFVYPVVSMSESCCFCGLIVNSKSGMILY